MEILRCWWIQLVYYFIIIHWLHKHVYTVSEYTFLPTAFGLYHVP